MIIAILSIIIGGFALLIADPEKNLIVSIIGMLFLLSGVVSMYIEENKIKKAPPRNRALWGILVRKHLQK